MNTLNSPKAKFLKAVDPDAFNRPLMRSVLEMELERERDPVWQEKRRRAAAKRRRVGMIAAGGAVVFNILVCVAICSFDGFAFTWDAVPMMIFGTAVSAGFVAWGARQFVYDY